MEISCRLRLNSRLCGSRASVNCAVRRAWHVTRRHYDEPTWTGYWENATAFKSRGGAGECTKIHAAVMDAASKRVSVPPAAGRAWLFQLTPRQRSTLLATFGGWALDGMDVMAYTFVIPSLIAAWQISKGEAGLLAAGGLLMSSVGGWLAGLLADRFGRVRGLQMTIAWFAFFTFLSGFTNSFWQLMLTRSLQGLGFGGEWAVGSVLMGEAIRAQHRGK